MIFKEGELTQKIIGVSMQIHTALGPGFKESVYVNALVSVLRKEGLLVEIEKPYKVFLHGDLIGNFRVDVAIDGKIILEIKAISGKMPLIFQSQLVSYLKASQIEVGLLINFGNNSLEFKRIVHYLSCKSV